MKGGSESDHCNNYFQTHLSEPIGTCGVYLNCQCCNSVFISCNHCAFSYFYCSSQCAISMRRATWKAASKRYQSSSKGARNHAQRQRRYRKKLRSSSNKVTHHTSQQPLDSVESVSPILAIKPNRKVEGSVQCIFCKIVLHKFYRSKESCLEVSRVKRRRNRRNKTVAPRGSP